MSKLKVNTIRNLADEDFVAALIAASVPTGEIKAWAFSTNPTGWVTLNGTTIGDDSSGADLADADTESLFTLLWTEADNTELPILDDTGTPSTRGASAAADFAAHKRMPLPDWRGLIPRGIGTSQINSRDKVGPSGLREKQEDQFQPHRHMTGQRSLTWNQGTGSSGTLSSTTGTHNIRTDAESSFSYIEDSGNGVPRTGPETRGSSFGVNWIMKL